MHVPTVLITHTFTDNTHCIDKVKLVEIFVMSSNDLFIFQRGCSDRVHQIQTFNINYLNHFDIPYSFIIGGDGNVYEGRDEMQKQTVQKYI